MLHDSLVFRVRWLSACLALFMATEAGAKPKSAPLTPAEKQAAEHTALAAQALKTGDAATAVRELKAAHELATNLDVEVELARTEVASGDVLAGRDTLRAALATYAASLGATRAPLEAELARFEARIAHLTLDVSEPGASVKLDQRELGVSPLVAPAEANPGAHTLEVTKAGFVASSREVDLGAGTTAIRVDLVQEKTTGRLLVNAATTEPLTVSLNQKPAGTLPLQADLPPGNYRIEAVSRTLRAEPQTVPVELGQTTSVTLSVAAVPGEANINASAADATIFIDDRPIATNEWHGELAPGAHQLRVERKGYAPYRQALDVASGERLVVDQIAYVPLAAPASNDALAEYDGLFVDVDLMGMFGPRATNSIVEQCAANAAGGDCTSTHPTGGGLGVRVGYSFGWIAAEGLLLGAADASTATANYHFATPSTLGSYYGVERQEHYLFVSYGYGLGAGARVLTRDSAVRVSGGLDGVLLYRTSQYVRETTAKTTIPDATSDDSKAEHSVNPGFMADLGVLLGGTPGFKFHFGLQLLVEFPPDKVTTPGITKTLGRDTTTGAKVPYGTPALNLSRGPQMVVGPFLAMQFGH